MMKVLKKNNNNMEENTMKKITRKNNEIAKTKEKEVLDEEEDLLNDDEITESDSDDLDAIINELDEDDSETDDEFTDEDESEDEEENELDDEEDDEGEDGEDDAETEASEDEEDEEDGGEEEKIPAKKRTSGSKSTSKKVKKEEIEEEEETIPPAVELLKSVEDEKFGPERGRRLHDKSFSKSTTIATKAANRDENLASLIDKLNENGLGYIFEGLKFVTERKKLASIILQSVEESALDCLYNKKTSFAFLNGRIDLTHIEGKMYPKFGKMMKTDVYKAPHDKINLVNCEFNRKIGAIYNVDGTSELTVPCTTDGKKIKISEDCLCYKKGDIVSELSGKVEGGSETPKKKVVKKKK